MTSTVTSKQSTRPPALPSFFKPGIGDLVFIAIFILVLLSGTPLINSDGDLGRHLTLGQYILDARQIPARDIFSHTMSGQPFIPHEWLSEVIFALSYRLLGMDGVILLCAVLIASTMWLCYRQIVQRSGLVILSLAMMVLVWLTNNIHWLARPHLFTMLIIVIWVGGMERLRKGQIKYWWWLPVLMCIWVNLHGAFIAGFVIWGIYFAGWIWENRSSLKPKGFPTGSIRIWLSVGFLSGLAALINPSGWRIWGNSVGYISTRFLVDQTVEYRSPDFHDPVLWPFAGVILLLIFLAGINHLKLKPASLLLLLFWTAMGLYSTRNIPLFGLIAIPILAEASSDFLRVVFPSRGNAEGGLFSGIAVLVTILVLLIGKPAGIALPNDAYKQKFFPVEAVNWLENNPPSGNMFNHFIWGGYLLHRLWPDQLVFIDGQTDFYGEALSREYVSVVRGEVGWQDVLIRHQISWAILPTDSLAARLIQNELNWKIAYQDETAVVLEE